jgi:hypothetical protein
MSDKIQLNMRCEDMGDELCFITEVTGILTKELVSFKDQRIREKLVALGWTPPPERG